MAKYKVYPEYKDSGVEWLGDIPEHWEVFTGKRIFQSVRTPALKHDEQLAASQKFGVIPQSLMMQLNDSKVMLALKGTDSFRHVDENNFVISLRSFEGGIEHSKYSGCVSPAYTVLKNIKQLSYGYYRYLLKCAPFIAALQSSTDSLRDGKSINYEQFSAIFLPIASIFEQAQIAAFLDYETAKIDKLIEKQQQLIELLKEKRQAVISHAVTKGLNPDVPMKDSGVEWLGEVPAHWKVAPLKHLCSLIKDGTHLPPPRVDKGVPLLSVRNIINGKFNFRDDDSQISYKDYKSLCSSFIPKKDDVLLAIVGATLGKVALVPEMESFHIQRSLGVFRTNELVQSQQLSYIFESKNFQNLLWGNVGFSAQPGIYLGTLANFSIPVPPINEQTKIIEFISNAVNKLDHLLAQTAQFTSLMQERRTALISAAVTGKIDVRDWVAPEAREVEVLQEVTA
ncbi:restriction endonuclease subunit S [Yersinia enterocolitica]|uniref:restriction endonuclease subunit S n=1 Tax=Yersinia enterocolitica TaxID=630 RepID=UPI00288F33A3|nr:restriction endonuclease subunit S [Yersinia enterocolitica]EKN3999506.1 restriction endonuclease subunit S [Yersinia enterocolitica]EKN4146377.1 restriction endonuclease subunit S [Yersinia enterocolitica]EKN4768196.1 restriction endonuclease subunit S [Yersinia enterocolitica]EKN4894973.1 restriction endonuclease subunit S [Yersinia enterocolitica]